MRQARMDRRGVTLIELLVTLVVLAFLGLTLTRILVSDSRFVSKQDAMMMARQSARAAMNSIVSELRMVGDSGLTAAAAKQITVRIPYAFGMLCKIAAGKRIAVVLPSDSASYASAIPGGMIWRDSLGVVHVQSSITLLTSGTTSACHQDSIRTGIGGSRLVSITPTTAATSGNLFYLFETVTYRFGPSVDVPGRVALWRKSGSAADEELVAPFDTSAGFAFLKGAKLIRVTTPPPVDSIRGLELKLVAASIATPSGSSKPQTFDLRTRVAFLNKRSD